VLSTASRNGCSLLSFGWGCVVCGGVLGLIGFLWRPAPVTRTTGVIVESTRVAGAWNRRLITYDYVAYGVHHRGQRSFGWGRSNPSGYYEVGQPFQVYFETAKPEVSYGPGPPRAFTLYFPAIGFAGFGIAIIVLALRAGVHT